MALLQEKDRNKLKDMFGSLKKPVSLVNFSQDFECQLCRETRLLLQELAEVNSLIRVAPYDFVKDTDAVAKHAIDKIPATVVTGEKDYRIRFYGIPAGYELMSLIEAIRLVSAGDSGLAPATRKALKALAKPVHLQVFVTPTCPYCPAAVILAHRMALESELVTADMIETSEFPHLAQKYSVRGVPMTVINDKTSLTGALPEAAVVQAIQAAIVAQG